MELSQDYDTELWSEMKSRFAPSRMAMLQSGQLTLNGKTMKFTYKTKGERPANGYMLIFGFHGGGGCPANVNDSQYNNHKNLYGNMIPDGSIWFAPRSCEDAWDMWFKDYMEDFLLEIIRAFVLNDLVDINRVFLTGYSAGGDGIYHMAPRMADHLAGAAMMAGHPNGINLMNVRNIPFSIQVGQKDNAYNRVNEAIKYSRMLAQLKQNYGGYQNICKIQPGKPHWMDRQDAKIFSWLFGFKRNPYPDIILFKQCPRRKKTTFYYLRLGQSKNGNDNEQVAVFKQGNSFRIFSNRVITVLVNRKMVNPNQPIRIIHNNQVTVNRQMQSQPDIAKKTLLQRIDPYYIFQDQLISTPPNVIDIKAAFCQEFNITTQEKDAQYEPQLTKNPDQTPGSFSRSMQALVSRKSPLPNFSQNVSIQLQQFQSPVSVEIQRQTNNNFKSEQGSWQNWGSSPPSNYQPTNQYNQNYQQPQQQQQQQYQGNQYPQNQNQFFMGGQQQYPSQNQYMGNQYMGGNPYNPYNQYAPNQPQYQNQGYPQGRGGNDCTIA